ncbi:MAG TPA: hypothetical protein VJT67_12080 [Longimicrobiaceae bacterium]|nr:hypothetical protein [Longimicrobiaceae bacterium]
MHFMQRTAKSRDGCFNGTIRQVAYAILRQARVLPGDRLVMLDLHMDALHSDPGVFTIVPDDPTVPTGTRDPAADVWENNPRAVALGHAIARSISRWTGLEQRQCRELGVMSERETRVGSSGRRLSMFRVTAPLRDRLIRLLIEHGSLGRDAAILHDPATPRACAEAAAAAVESFFHPRPAP